MRHKRIGLLESAVQLVLALIFCMIISHTLYQTLKNIQLKMSLATALLKLITVNRIHKRKGFMFEYKWMCAMCIKGCILFCFIKISSELRYKIK